MGSFPFLPTLASEHGAQVDQMILAIHVIMLIAFIGWGVFYLVPLFKFRKKKNPQADYRGLRTRIPIVCVFILAVIELVLLFGFSIPFWEEHVAAGTYTDQEPITVRVVGQQFQWNMHYPGPDGIFGRTDPSLVDDQLNPLGIDPDDPNGEDDVSTLGQLHLPVDRDIEIQLASKDVIHSFFLPEFRVKQDAIPGMLIPLHFRPTMTTAEFRELEGDETRNFEIACAQLCGLGHYRMRGFVTIHPQEEFDAWMEEQIQMAQDSWF